MKNYQKIPEEAIFLGYIGVSQPCSLSVAGFDPIQGTHLLFTGQAGFNYKIQASKDLINWADMALLVNSNGVVLFVDPYSTNLQQRFYRTVIPY